MAALYGAPPRNLSRFKLTHAELAGGGPGPGLGELAPRYRGDNITVHPDLLCLPFGERSPLLFLFFVNDRAVKRRVTGATPALTNRCRDPLSLDTCIIRYHGNSTSFHLLACNK